MKKLKCSSCGGNMTVDEKQEFATCDYCGTVYKLNEDLNVNIKLDDNMKDVLDNGVKGVKTFSKLMFIPIIMAFIIFFVIFLVVLFRFFSFSSPKVNYDPNGTISEFDIKSFNSRFELFSGTKSKFFVESLLDHVVTNNKTNADKIITVVYGDRNTTDVDEIVEIKHSLEYSNYEISLDYDGNGFVNKVTISKL